MENINNALDSVKHALPVATSRSDQDPLTIGLSAAGNQPELLSQVCSSNTPPYTEIPAYRASMIKGSHSTPSGLVDKALGDVFAVNRMDTEQYNTIKLPLNASAATAYLKLSNISIDIEKDAKILDKIINLTVSKNKNFADNEGYFNTNTTITLTKRPDMQFIYSNFATVINSKLSITPNLDLVSKYIFYESENKTVSEHLILPGFVFGNDSIANTVFRSILEATEEFLDSSDRVDNAENREFFFTIVLSIYRLAELLKKESIESTLVDEIKKTIRDFNSLFNLGIVIENNYSLLN